jgi:two-component system KDP operon response regulator KdpE
MGWSTEIVLIVDREDHVLKILRTALQSTDYVLLHATTGNEALAVLSRLKHPLDLAVIDLDIPNDAGLVASLLAILGPQKTTKIIVKTSRQDKRFLESVTYFGIDAIVVKPISDEQFIKTVREALGRNDSARTSAGTAT